MQSGKQALTICQQLKERQCEGSSLSDISAAYHGLKNYFQAIAFAQQALAISLKIGDRNLQSGALNSLGIAYTALKNYPQATTYYTTKFNYCSTNLRLPSPSKSF